MVEAPVVKGRAVGHWLAEQQKAIGDNYPSP